MNERIRERQSIKELFIVVSWVFHMLVKVVVYALFVFVASLSFSSLMDRPSFPYS